MTSPDDQRYRREQEEFVSNHGGSTSREVVFAILPNVCGVMLTASTLGMLGKGLNPNVRILLEFCFNILPCVLCCTILEEHVIMVCLAMMTVSIINVVLILIRKRGPPKIGSNVVTRRRPFVTNFRALTNIITAVCILAVDFRIFSRKFAKTEVYGYSLMDTGVGLFIIANSLVAPEARDFGERPKETLTRRLARNSKFCVKNCAPLLVLGLGRFIAVEYSGYQRHVTEYGVHWNFFVTLAFVKMFTSTIATAINSRYSLISGVWILAMHEYALSTKGLKDWVLGDGPRNDFVSANREGLVSVPGYVGLYLVGLAIGRLIHSTYANVEQRSKFQRERYGVRLRIFGRDVEFEYNESMVLCVKLSLISAQECAATLLCDRYFGVSRRLANAGYCCWILTLSCTVLTLLLLVEVTTDIIIHAASNTMDVPPINRKEPGQRGTKKKHVGFKLDEPEDESSDFMRNPEILVAVNYNGLMFFLLANLLTGIINMSVKTLYVTRDQAIKIIVGYIGVCLLVAVVLYRYKIQIKL